MFESTNIHIDNLYIENYSGPEPVAGVLDELADGSVKVEQDPGVVYSWTTDHDFLRQIRDLRSGGKLVLQLNDDTVAKFTLHRRDGSERYFVCDDCVARRPIFEELPDEVHPFEDSDLHAWLNDEFRSLLPLAIQRLTDEITIPSSREIFGTSSKWANEHHAVDGNEEQLQLMRLERHYRVAFMDGEEGAIGYWLRNHYKEDGVVSASNFALVDADGYAGGSIASPSRGVRPAFAIDCAQLDRK